MSPSYRSAVRAATFVIILLILIGCAAKPRSGVAVPTQAVALATQPPVTVGPTVVTVEPSRTSSPTPGAVPATTQQAGSSSGSPRPVPEDQPVEPHFGPAWGDRTIYESGLVSSERKVWDELQGASEYRIDLRIDDSLTHVSGDQQVRYTNREDTPLAEIYLRLFPNALGGKMRVSDVTVDGVDVLPEYEYASTALRVSLPESLAVGESTVLGLKYQIDVPQTLDTGYGLLSYTDRILALDTPYAVVPVYDKAGWNVEIPPENADTSFNDASFYVVRISAPEELKLVATGVEVDREDAGRRQVVTYEQGPARDFFVAASPDYIVATKQAGYTRVNAYAMPGEEAAQEVALDAAAEALNIYSRRFGPYPYTELDVAATPMLALGIEYPGAVGISERVYEPDYEPSVGTASTIVESTVAHEMAHQWFYNLVGNDQQDEPWLDEALAQYSTWLYFVDRYGKAAGEAWEANWGARWDRSDREEKPVGLPADEYTQPEYGSIVYGRGPMFVSALAERMGQQEFDQFLKDYAARFRWDIARADEFKTMAQEACGCDLGDLYSEWLDPS